MAHGPLVLNFYGIMKYTQKLHISIFNNNAVSLKKFFLTVIANFFFLTNTTIKMATAIKEAFLICCPVDMVKGVRSWYVCLTFVQISV